MEITEALRSQAQACARLGSPMYAELLDWLADDHAAGGSTSGVLAGHEDDPGPSALALRLAGGLHRLVLAGQEPALARHYPTAGGRWDLDAARPDVLEVLERRRDDLRQLLGRAPQTNEVGRSAALLGGLLVLASRLDLPVRLFELGASGGLNLHADAFRYTTGDGRGWGPADSPVVLRDAWRGSVPELRGAVRIVERAGCDVAPVDVSTEDGRLTLASYVWPDMTARHGRLRGAIDIARRDPAPVRRQGAGDFLDSLELVEGTLTVVWHSVMWQYVPGSEQQRARHALHRLGEQATPEQPLARLYAEPLRREAGEEHHFWVCLEQWPDSGEREYLGRMRPHGVPVDWE
ncbi:MAG TPA: DUF2332 domain-containing protein [Marmoricola sp.]